MDSLSKKQRSERMSLVKNKNTGPELIVRKIVYGLGYRYRLHGSHLPGNPDIFFSKRKKVIFVHGCFWHRHPDPACKLARLPKSRLGFWVSKLEGNYKRDLSKQHELSQQGWKVLVIWECQLKNDQLIKSIIKEFL